MPGLQSHMLRVASVASLICDSINIPVDRESVIATCLLHDMGNIIKSDLNVFPEFLEPQGREYWEKVKSEYIAKYGTHEHEATLKIIKELGVSKKVFDLATGIDFPLIFKILNKSIEAQICLYADNRVDPLGIVSVKERLTEGRNRYKDRPNRISEENWNIAESTFEKLEQYIFSKCKIKPEDINNENAAPVISKLRDFVIKP